MGLNWSKAERMNYATEIKAWLNGYTRNFEKIIDREGCFEGVVGFLNHYGHKYSSIFMEIYVESKLFSEQEFEVLNELEECFIQLLENKKKSREYTIFKKEWDEINLIRNKYLRLQKNESQKEDDEKGF